jgi:sialic acid synthase SpsE
MGIGVALASIPLGAAAIEKHFTLSRKTGGVDSAFSIEPLELKELVEETRNVCQAIGKIKYGPTVQEKNSLIYRRSIYIVKDMKAGEVFTRENLRVIRPGFGLPSKELEMVLGKKINREALRGTALTRKMTSK